MTHWYLNINLIIYSFLASEASQKKIVDFDVSNMSISEFWVRLLETDCFVTVPLSKIIFHVDNSHFPFLSLFIAFSGKAGIP